MEHLRLYPPTPLLVTHESSKDCTICVYDEPQGTMLLVHLWAMHRDPKVWVDASKFMPKRFEEKESQGHKWIPFGIGRRGCPGAALGRRVMGLVLGVLVQMFEWERASEDEIDMKGVTGISMSRAEPSEALCKPRQAMIGLLSLPATMNNILSDYKIRAPASYAEAPPPPTQKRKLKEKSRLMFSWHQPLCKEVKELISPRMKQFANCPCTRAGKHLNYDDTRVGHGKLWRNLQLLTSLEIFSTNCSAMFSGICHKEVEQLLKQLSKASLENLAKVEMKSKYLALSFYGEDDCGSSMSTGTKYLEATRRGRVGHVTLTLQEKEPELHTDIIIKGMISVKAFCTQSRTPNMEHKIPNSKHGTQSSLSGCFPKPSLSSSLKFLDNPPTDSGIITLAYSFGLSL
ncbi:Cytochrome P450 [Dillenia turbinata]|uniref:Cytochrome P450 n=1 Tax=Dillenia turbinata TaxID=194707 RepID=A0AAN8W489_9MAGN